MGVVSIGVAGRLGGERPADGQVAASGAAVAAAVTASGPLSAASAADGAADVPRAPLGVPYAHDRVHGTDGLMGGLPFGLPGDTPLVRLQRVNRFTIDDIAVSWSEPDSTPPWTRRVGGLASYQVDQYAS